MKKIIVAGFICLALSACVTTLHPLVTYDKVITDERLAGKWTSDDREFIVQQFYKSNLYKLHQQEIEDAIGTGKKEKTGKTNFNY